MKNTKKAVALALALIVGSQAGMSFAEEIKEPTDVVAPSSRSDLEVKVDGDEITINQKGIYDLESGIDADSVKAYVHEEGDDSKGEEIEMKGNDFSDFTATVENPSNGEDLVVDVYASDLAGNESKVGSTVVSAVEEEEPVKCGNVGERDITNNPTQGQYLGFSYNPSNGHTINNNTNIIINPNKPFEASFAFDNNDGSFSEMSFTVTSQPNSETSGLLMRGIVNKDGNMSSTSLSSSVEVTDFSVYHDGYFSSRADLTFDFSGSPEDSTYYLWVKNPDGNYVLSKQSLVVDTKAPIAKKDLSLSISKDGTLMISQDELVDEACSVYEVYSVVTSKDGSLNETVYLDGDAIDENGEWHEPTKFDGTLNLRDLGFDRGSFTVEVYALDSVGNEGLVSTGTINYNMEDEEPSAPSVPDNKPSIPDEDKPSVPPVEDDSNNSTPDVPNNPNNPGEPDVPNTPVPPIVDGDNKPDEDDSNNSTPDVPNKPSEPNIPVKPGDTEVKPDEPNLPTPPAEDGDDNLGDDKPSVPVNPSEPEEGNKPSNPDNGEIDKPADTDNKPNIPEDSKPNDDVVVTPDNGSGNSSSNGTTSTPSTSVDEPKLPQTGEPVSMLAGALGVITSGLGFVLTRKKK